MPYIKKEDRIPVSRVGPTTEGELNYILTMDCISLLGKRGLSYGVLNNLIGALDHALASYLKGESKPPYISLDAQLFRAILVDYAKRHSAPKYDVRDEVAGAVRCCQHELYRRIAVPYENIKIRENGDVFPRALLTPQ